MSVRILQDHTDLMDRLVNYAADSPQGMPLSVPVLELIRTRCVGTRYRGKIYTIGQLKELAEQAPEAEDRAIQMAIASAVELEIEAWYCVSSKSVDALESHHVGPVVRWNGAAWWAKLTGVEVPIEVVFDEEFTKRKRNNRPGAATNEKIALPPAPQPAQGQTLRRGNSPEPL